MSCSASYEVDAVGIGAAGFVDQTRSTVLFAPNLAWRDEPVKKLVEERIGRPVVVENDANAAAWAEAKLGAARGQQQVMLITVGHRHRGGHRAGRQALPRPVRLGWRAGALPGRARGPPVRLRQPWLLGAVRQRQCPGRRGARLRPQVARGRCPAAPARRRHGRGYRRARGHHGGTRGDVGAVRCFEIVGDWLGAGLADLAAILDPGCFVIGGGVSEAGELLLNPAREAYEHGLTGRSHREFADVRLAELGPDAGLIGAADLARNGDG